MRKNNPLVDLFSGNKRLLKLFYQRIENQDLLPRHDDPIEIKVALRAYSNFISDSIQGDKNKIKRIQKKLICHHDKENYGEETHIQCQ